MQRNLFTGCACPTCPAQDDCAVKDSDEACGDPMDYPDAAHPATLPVDAGDLRLPDWAWPSLPELPSAITIGDYRSRSPVGAIRLRDAGWLTAKPGSSHRVSVRTTVLLGRDDYLLQIWERRGDLGRRLRRVGFRLIVGPGYSTWTHTSPFDVMVAMARSAHFAATLARSVPTIPTVVWRYLPDLDRWAEWIVGNGITAAAVDLGTAQRGAPWDEVLRGLGHLAESLGGTSARRTRLVVVGVSSVRRIGDIIDVWRGDVTFVSQTPWFVATRGRRLLPGLRSEADHETPRPLLIARNARTFKREVAALTTAAHVPIVESQPVPREDRLAG